MKPKRAPLPGEVWRSRVTHDEKRTVLVLDVGTEGRAKDTDAEVTGERVHTQTLTTVEGVTPMRTTRTRVLLTNWHHTFAYERDATAEELVDAGISAATRETTDIPQLHSVTLPVTPCSVVWSNGHPWVLDGEPGIPSALAPRRWIGLDDTGSPQVRTRAEMFAAGFSVVYIDTDGDKVPAR